MYSIRTTPGLIIGSKSYGEAGKLLFIFSRDFGLIAASAAGIRLEKSKLRYYTSDYSFGTFSLVKGKEFWKLTNAAAYHDDNNEYFYFSESKKIALLGRISFLLRRLLHGEDAHVEVFRCLETLLLFLKNEEVNDEQMKTLESLTLIRILKHLGYVAISKDNQIYVDSYELTKKLLDSLSVERLAINGLINKALRESQL